MRFLIVSALLVATIMALGLLGSIIRQTAPSLLSTKNSQPGETPFSTPIVTSTPPSTSPLVLTPLPSPTIKESQGDLTAQWGQVDGEDLVFFTPSDILQNQQNELVIYSHGAGETISASNKNSKEVQKLKDYAQKLTRQGFLLAASNMHGDNWGSEGATEQIDKLIAFLQKKYALSKKVDLWAFSMGGLAAMKYAVQNPEKVDKIALLAPSVDLDYWTKERISALSQIPVKIWHGNKDQNVPYQQSQKFLQKLLQGGVPVEFETVPQAGHFDLKDPDGLTGFFGK